MESIPERARLEVHGNGAPWGTLITVEGKPLPVRSLELGRGADSGTGMLSVALEIPLPADAPIVLTGRLGVLTAVDQAALEGIIGHPAPEPIAIRVEWHRRMTCLWLDGQPVPYLYSIRAWIDAAQNTTRIWFHAWPQPPDPADPPEPLKFAGEIFHLVGVDE